MSTKLGTGPSSLTEIAPTFPHERKARPVLWLAAAGGIFLFFYILVIGLWIASGPQTVPPGPTPLPGWMKISLNVQQILFTTAAVVVVYVVVIRAWRRERRLTLDGILVISLGLMFVQDPISAYYQPWYGYNAYQFNLGSWMYVLPGFDTPQGAPPEPLFFAGAFYVGLAFLGVALLNWIMAKAKKTWPSMGKPGLVLVAFSYVIALDLIVEQMWLRLGNYAYPGGVWKGFSLWYGHRYQFPLYGSLLLGGLLAAIAALRYFRNDKGQTLAERGIERVQFRTSNQKGWVRFLSIFGLIQILMLVMNVLFLVVVQWQSDWPASIQTRSYFTNGYCGPGTRYACPGDNIPVPQRRRGGVGGAYMAPDGKMVVPSGGEPKEFYPAGNSWNPYQKGVPVQTSPGE